MAKEAKARIKINKLLEESGGRFFDGPEQLEISKYLKSEEKQVSLLQEKINIHDQNIIQKTVKLLG